MLVEFRGARVETDLEGEKEYRDRGPIWIETKAVIGIYEHTIVTERRNFFVMETVPEIIGRLQPKDMNAFLDRAIRNGGIAEAADAKAESWKESLNEIRRG
jgi:hypothetical protein